MSDLFREILPSIMQTKRDVLENESDYVPFLVNKALSYHKDTILLSNLVNQNPHLNKRLQYDFFLNTVRPHKRQFTRWVKRVEDGDLEVVKEYYGYNDAKAYDALRILTDEQIATMKEELRKGD